MPFHLSLSPIDQVNQPPVYYLQVQDALIVLSGLLWTVAYCLYVRQAFRDHSYGMPLLSLWANVAWEFLFAVVLPLSSVQTVVLLLWLTVDVGLVYTTWRFGPNQWKQAPWISRRMGSIVLVGILLMTILFWTFALAVGVEAASFYIAYGNQLLLSVASVAHILSRDNTSGHSIGIWFFRAAGTCATILLFVWRYWHYPQSYPRVANPTVLFLFVGSEVADLIYPAVYLSLGKQSTKSHVL